MKEDILKLLNANNKTEAGVYIPQDVEKYVDKIIKFSKIISVYENGMLQGFISYYKNDPNKKNSFLSMLFIDKEFQSCGLGSILLETAIQDLKNNSYTTYQLEVLRTNEKAFKLYSKFGFKVSQENNELIVMELQLN